MNTQCLFVGSMSQLVRCRLQLSLELSVVLGKATIGADHRSHQHRGPTMGTAVRPAKTSPGPWDAFADVDAFVDEVLVERAAMAKDGSRPIRSGPKPGPSQVWGSGGNGRLRVCIVSGSESLSEAGAERPIVDGAANLEQKISPSPRPTHLL